MLAIPILPSADLLNGAKQEASGCNVDNKAGKRIRLRKVTAREALIMLIVLEGKLLVLVHFEVSR